MSPCGATGPQKDSEEFGTLAEETVNSTSTAKMMSTCNNPSTCTTQPCDTTKEDILSVKNYATKEILPPLARKLAKAATLTAVLLQPVKDVFNNIEDKIDMMEIACSPNSTLTNVFEENGHRCLPVNRMSGFDFDTKAGTMKLTAKLETDTPKLGWVSLPCTRLSSLPNLTERDEESWAKLLKKQGQSLEPLFANGDIACEWPKSAIKGWRSSSIRRLQRLAEKYNRIIYKINIDGCAYGMTWNGLAIKKGWQILTASRTLWLMVAKRCPQNHVR